MSTRHVVVWIDHEQAHVLHFDPEHLEGNAVKARSTHKHSRHPARDMGGSRHPTLSTPFCAEVVEAIGASEEILVTGPASAKEEFMAYLHQHAPLIAKRVLGIVALDHPTDPQIVAFARKYFRAKDRLLGDAGSQG